MAFFFGLLSGLACGLSGGLASGFPKICAGKGGSNAAHLCCECETRLLKHIQYHVAEINILVGHSCESKSAFNLFGHKLEERGKGCAFVTKTTMCLKSIFEDKHCIMVQYVQS